MRARPDFIGKLNQHLLRALLAEPHDLGEIVQVALADSAFERLARRTAQYRERRLRPHARDGKDKFEEIAVSALWETIQLEPVLFKGEVGGENCFRADRERF